MRVSSSDLSSEDYDDEPVGPDHEYDERDEGVLDEDLYGFAFKALVHDLDIISSGRGKKCLRLTQLNFAVLLLFVNIIIQATLLYYTKTFVTAKAVHSIRSVYDRFEFVMYGSDNINMELTQNGKRRGIEQYFNEEHFDTLNEEEKASACCIPFSEPYFLMLVLFVWTLSCCTELKRTKELFVELICELPLVHYVEHQLKRDSAAQPDEEMVEALEMGGIPEGRARALVKKIEDKLALATNTSKLVGLTWCVKVVVVTLIILPKLLITCGLLLLGCRWLSATTSFADIIVNTVALEFILCLKDLLFNLLVSARSKREMSRMSISLPDMGEHANFWTFLGTALWGIFAVAWVAVYMFQLQTVLPDYRWDVHDVCEEWVRTRYLS
eukprot:NODE_8986_length_1454_cov_8.574228.p1 GENE.NODE_8986_length_1454_cov_8.574228~~NODE_8986_length_1454_cov_8.574228.p1  ORF type:complete len:383 (-),score=96.54 NODE_8986_length_1454_cov_8.574228:213-1361(-)